MRCLILDDNLQIEHLNESFGDGLCSKRMCYTNKGESAITLQELISCDIEITASVISRPVLIYFTSYWGSEFTPARTVIPNDLTLREKSGRSSATVFPFFLVFDGSKILQAISIAHSGNWVAHFGRTAKGIRVVAGAYTHDLQILPGETLHSPEVLTVEPINQRLSDVTKAFTKWARKHLLQNEITRQMPVEWNPWWPYDDSHINEEIFLNNVDVAAELGIEVCVLDAGWYGTSENWFMTRGDWGKVNTERFPHGIKYLSDYVHSKGMLFGLWCEIEAIGVNAEINLKMPELMAKRDSKDLGYACLGHIPANDWAYAQLDLIITEYNLDWVKLDFNLNPGLGCNRTDHVHKSDRGLLSHYKGYYEVLDKVRSKHPKVILENCSSGGLRIDHAILQHTHATFLSDQDESGNRLRYNQAVLHFLPPFATLQWSWSEFVPWDKKYMPNELDFHLRCGMLGCLGFSHKLIEFDDDTRKLFKRHIQFYKDTIRAYIQNSYAILLHPLDFPIESNYYAWQYQKCNGKQNLIYVFVLNASEVTIILEDIREASQYILSEIDKPDINISGVILRNGLSLGNMEGKSSRIFEIFQI